MKTWQPLRIGRFCVFLCSILTAYAVPTPSERLSELEAGNARYAAGTSTHPRLTAERRQEVAKGQNPFATVLSCSDSRVPVEQLFDQGVGDLFVVRVAGNVAQEDEIGSVEYGTGHLNTPLLIVLGHESCGAVKAVVENAAVHGSIPALLEAIRQPVDQARANHPGFTGDALVHAAVEANVMGSIKAILSQSRIVRDLVRSGKLKVVGAVYDLGTGAVRWQGIHPEQAGLLAVVETVFAAHDETGAHGEPQSSHAAPAHEAEKASKLAGDDAEHSTRLSGVSMAAGVLVLLGIIGAVYVFSNRGMRKWPVSRRLAFGFTLILAVLAGLAVEGYVSLHTALSDFTAYRSDARHSVLSANIMEHYLEMQNHAKDLALFSNPKSAAEYTRHKDALLELVKQMEQIFHEPELLEKLTVIEADVKKHVELQNTLRQAVASGHRARIAEAAKNAAEFGERIDAEASALLAEFEAQQNRDGPRMSAEIMHTQSVIIGLGIAAVLLGVGLAIIISRSISNPLAELAGNLGAGADQTTAAAAQVSSSSQSLAEGASEQAASMEETSASLEELSSMTKRNAEHAQEARTVAATTQEAASVGARQMQEMAAAMEGIQQSSDEVTKIVKTIDEIAFQTNILALNAAVEAARAGEHGAGFAVVADEVRALAQRSATAAKETAVKIEESVGKSRQGVELSQQVSSHFGEIVGNIKRLVDLVAEIASASREQNDGIGQMTQAVTQIDQVTQTNASAAEETAAAAEELHAQGQVLLEGVNLLRSLAGITTGEKDALVTPSRGSRPEAAMPGREVPTKKSSPSPRRE